MLKSFYSIQSTSEPLKRVPQIRFRSGEFLQAATCSSAEAEREQRAARSALLLHAREKEEVRKQTQERGGGCRLRERGSEDGRKARGRV